MLSKLSVIFAVIGVMFLAASYLYTNNFELLMLSGFGVMFVGLLLSFWAMAKREYSKLKFVAVATFFVFCFIISWNEPLQILRLLTWIKN